MILRRFLQKIKRKIPVNTLFGVVFLALFISCGNKSFSEGNQKGSSNRGAENKNEAPITVTVDKAVAREIPSYIQATGSLIADETTDVAPKVAGKVVNVSVNVGSFIRQGDVIAKIDDKDARLRLAEAQAGVVQAQAAVRQAEARLGLGPNGTFEATAIPEVRTAKANYEQALAELNQALAELKQAEANEKRYRELTETGDVAVITYETYRTTRDAERAQANAAQARVNAAKQQYEAALNTARQSNQAIKSAQAAVEAARTQVETAQQAVADTVVRAPMSGFVSNRPVAVGEFVSTASVLATILRTNPIKVQIQISEADVPNATVGRGVSVEVDAYKDRRFSGTVTAVNPALDAASRSAIVEAEIENGNNALRAGMFATVRINKQGGQTGIFVPRSAVYNDQSTQSYRVFVIQENVAKLRVVQIGPEENDMVQILNGINADETVATNNLQQLYEGAKVSY